MNKLNKTQESLFPTVKKIGGAECDGVSKTKNLNKLNFEYKMGLKLLPNVRDFSIKVGAPESLFYELGIKINQKPELSFEP